MFGKTIDSSAANYTYFAGIFDLDKGSLSQQQITVSGISNQSSQTTRVYKDELVYTPNDPMFKSDDGKFQIKGQYIFTSDMVDGSYLAHREKNYTAVVETYKDAYGRTITDSSALKYDDSEKKYRMTNSNADTFQMGGVIGKDGNGNQIQLNLRLVLI